MYITHCWGRTVLNMLQGIQFGPNRPNQSNQFGDSCRWSAYMHFITFHYMSFWWVQLCFTSVCSFPLLPSSGHPRRMIRQESSGFQDVLVSLLLGRGFAFGKLPEGTVEDWLWYRLHLVPWWSLGEMFQEFPRYSKMVQVTIPTFQEKFKQPGGAKNVGNFEKPWGRCAYG